MARTTEEWAALLGSTLCKMARVHGTDAPDAYLPEECYPVIEKTFDVALAEARAEGYAAAMRDLQHNRPVREESPRRLAVIGQVMRAIPLARRMA
ncbi:hypothetical protein [Shinella fusca]|jgi:hypothetical protein|uniref:Uncharacterized protein n=1 Tax=Shinella fusca TaxID=544480 RepID=A0A7W8DV49_9HYPH|nr:hypothetical protein [Shinella fusca]MBB5043247.1 hypothetical protein [Shinella fusca]